MTPKKEFILDENVLIFAQTGLNEYENADPTCANLVNSIIRICHTIVIDLALYQRYQRQLNSGRHRPTNLGSALLPQLMGAAQIPGKYDGFHRIAAPPFDGENEIPQGSQDDVPVSVRLAVATRATLVTADTPLRQHLTTSGIQSRYNLNILSPTSALSTL